ncbi:MAG: hypothetical protein KIT22_02235 [Verrucomicrobiae bacterium]|nr:hypothetical protein [Verrucomicrobiae bacterium]
MAKQRVEDLFRPPWVDLEVVAGIKVPQVLQIGLGVSDLHSNPFRINFLMLLEIEQNGFPKRKRAGKRHPKVFLIARTGLAIQNFGDMEAAKDLHGHQPLRHAPEDVLALVLHLLEDQLQQSDIRALDLKIEFLLGNIGGSHVFVERIHTAP